jgi:NifU-like protein involved in Fe-S cluster formation
VRINDLMTHFSHLDPLPDIAETASAWNSLDGLYNPLVVDHITHPRNLGALLSPTGVGTVDDRETENLIIIYLRVHSGFVEAASFRALACSACIAASSRVTEILIGRSVISASLTCGDVLDALGGLPAAKEHCADLAAQAANLALEAARAA